MSAEHERAAVIEVLVEAKAFVRLGLWVASAHAVRTSTAMTWTLLPIAAASTIGEIASSAVAVHAAITRRM